MIPSSFDLLGLLARAWRWPLGLLLLCALALAAPALWRPAPKPLPEGQPAHVLLIGIDGLTYRALGKGNSPTIDRLQTEGAAALDAQAVLPTWSSANWASHLMGAGPERHGIRGNDWRREKWAEVSLCGRPVGAGWPSLFDLVNAWEPEATTAVIHDWIGIGRFVPRGAADRRWFTHKPGPTLWMAKRVLRLDQPRLTFIQLDQVDAAGHAHGFDSWQYHRAVADADRMVGELLEVLDEAGITEQSLVMLISDHGGQGRWHGGGTSDELHVPWILWGKGVSPGMVMAGGFSVTDTAPTLAYAMGLTPPDCWTGTAAKSAFLPR